MLPEKVGLKKRVSDALEDAERALSMGECMLAADIDKRHAAEVSSALHKLIKQQMVKVVSGAATSQNGPRTVRKYIWVGKVAVKVETRVEVASDPLRMLGVSIFRG